MIENETELEYVNVLFLTTLGCSKEKNSVIYDALTAIEKDAISGTTSNAPNKRVRHPKPSK